MTRTKKDWEEIGLLNDCPEDRKDAVTTAMNFTLDFIVRVQEQYTDEYFITRMSDGKTLKADDLVEFDLLFFPVIVRIAREVDINETQIKNLYNQWKFEYDDEVKKLISKHDGLNIDYEMMYCRLIADGAIEHIKNQ